MNRIGQKRNFKVQAVVDVPEDTAGATFELFDGGKILSRLIDGKSLSRFETREEAEKEAREILIDDHIDRSALARFFATGGSTRDDIVALSKMWTLESAAKYAVSVTFDCWDSHTEAERQEEESKPHETSWLTTNGTIVLDGIERKWWLRPCQNVYGQVICIDTGENDCHYWHLDWVMRPDWNLINFLILDTLVRRHPLTDDGDGAGEKMERLRRFEYRCEWCHEWSAKSICPCGGEERMRQHIDSLKSEQLSLTRGSAHRCAVLQSARVSRGVGCGQERSK